MVFYVILVYTGTTRSNAFYLSVVNKKKTKDNETVLSLNEHDCLTCEIKRSRKGRLNYETENHSERDKMRS